MRPGQKRDGGDPELGGVKVSRGQVYVEEALRTTREWQDRLGTVWTDGPRLGRGGVGAAVASWETGRWARRETYLGK